MPRDSHVEGNETVRRSRRIRTVAVGYLFVAILASAAACSGGTYSISGGHIGSSASGITASYRAFSGFYAQRFRIATNDTLVISFYAITERGSVVAQLRDAQGNVLATLQPGEERSLEDLPAGRYQARVEDRSHSGSFVLSRRLSP